MNTNENKPFWWPDMQGFAVVAIVIIAAAALFIRMFHTSNTDDKMLDTMITVLFTTCLVGVYNYLFGSSRGSSSKDDMLNRIAGTATTPPVAPSGDPVPVAKSSDAAAKALSWAAVLILGSLMFMPTAFAQTKLKPLTGNIGNDLGLTNTATAPGVIPSIDPQALIKKIMALAGPDLSYALAMATAAGTSTSKIRVTCLTAIQALNASVTGANLKDDKGNPLTEPSIPHIFTDLEQAAEGIDSLSPTGPLFTSCAGAAALAGMNVLAFINAVVAGTAATAIVIPK